ncbi:12716_t:CDS:2, partial [Gigaspora rosea]
MAFTSQMLYLQFESEDSEGSENSESSEDLEESAFWNSFRSALAVNKRGQNRRTR